MASTTLTNHVSKGLQNYDNPGAKFTFFGTNFNMPVPPSIAASSSTPITQFNYRFTYIGSSTSYDLTGFSPGFEICVGTSVLDVDNTAGVSPISVSGTLTIQWIAQNGVTVLLTNSVFISFSAPAGQFTETAIEENIGFQGTEIGTSGTYFFKSSWSGTPSASSVTTSVSFTNVPTITTLPSKDQGYMWVEGNNLAYVNANLWKHSIAGTLVGATNGSQDIGYIWLDGSDLHWVGSDTNNYKQPWKVAQFASYFTNSSTGPAPGTPLASKDYGSFWVDNEFGDTHLAYIATDGNKWLTGAGANPYI